MEENACEEMMPRQEVAAIMRRALDAIETARDDCNERAGERAETVFWRAEEIRDKLDNAIKHKSVQGIMSALEAIDEEFRDGENWTSLREVVADWNAYMEQTVGFDWLLCSVEADLQI